MNDSAPDSHYVQPADHSAGRNGDSPAPRIAVTSSCCYCHASLYRQDAVYCAACMAPHHQGCFQERGRCSTVACKETKTVSLAVPPDAQPEETPIQQAMSALREVRGHAARNLKQTRLAFDVTKAVADSGSLNRTGFGTTKFKRASS